MPVLGSVALRLPPSSSGKYIKILTTSPRVFWKIPDGILLLAAQQNESFL